MSYSMFMLTPMTGKAAAESRTVIISGFEIGFKTFVLCCIGALPGLALAIVTYPLLGSGSILMIPVGILAILYLFQSRSRDGLKLRTWQTMVDKRKAAINQFFICGEAVDLDADGAFVVVANTVDAAGTFRPKRQVDTRRSGAAFATSMTHADFHADELIGGVKGRYDAFRPDSFAPINQSRKAKAKGKKTGTLV